MWNLKTSQCEKTLTGHTYSVTCLEIAGSTIVSGSQDKTIKVCSDSFLGGIWLTELLDLEHGDWGMQENPKRTHQLRHVLTSSQKSNYQWLAR